MADIKPTLDAIDEAIDGYVTWQGSGDAMRWTAEDPADAVAYLAALGIHVTPWQAEVARQQFAEGARQLTVTMRVVANAIRPILEGFAAAVHSAAGLVEQIQDIKTEHSKQLHRAYRHRCLARRRRSR